MSLAEIVLSCLGGVLAVLVGLLSWVGSQQVSRVDRVAEKLAIHGEQLSAISAARTTQRLDDHEKQLREIKDHLGQIQTDVGIVRAILERGKEK